MVQTVGIDEPSELGADKLVPVAEHLGELRRRLMISLGIYLIVVVGCYAFAQPIYQFLLQPLESAYEGQVGRRLIYTGLAEAFFTYIKLALFSGFILTFPIWAWHAYRFAAPGLYRNEKRVLYPFLIAAPCLFIAGMAMVYWVVFPLAWQFFLSFEYIPSSGGLPIQLEAKISEYLSLVMQLMIAFGLAFQLPVLLLLLARAGLVTGQGLASKRRYAVVLIVMAAAIMTPPDVISQIGLALPLWLLYECSILACRWVETNKDDLIKDDSRDASDQTNE